MSVATLAPKSVATVPRPLSSAEFVGMVEAGIIGERERVELIVEIAESSLAYDRTVKTRLYAKAGIPDYWIIDAKSRAVEVHRDPSPTGYRTVERVTRRGTVSPAAFPDVAIVLRELFPPA